MNEYTRKHNKGTYTCYAFAKSWELDLVEMVKLLQCGELIFEF